MISVIGGGPSGMMAAYSAKLHNPKTRVVLFDRNPNLGKKMRLTGGGRCNVTANVSLEDLVKSVVKNGRFLYSSFNNLGPQEIQAFFKRYGVELIEEDHHRMFPKSHRSHDIVDACERALVDVGVELRLGVNVETLTPTSISVDGTSIQCEHIIIATGGRTLPQTGSDGSGYEFASALGHTVTNLLPQEVPLVSNDALIQSKALQGLSFKDVQVKVKDGKKTLATLTHDLIITHFGYSGPVALRASFYVQRLIENQKGPVTLEIDFMPGFQAIDDTHPNLQKRLLDVLSKQDSSLIDALKHFKTSIYATRGFSYAFVTNGGVMVKEIDPKTMKSKRFETISFCGEVMDVSAFTGGYNITAALSSGYTAGKYCMEGKYETVDIL